MSPSRRPRPSSPNSPSSSASTSRRSPREQRSRLFKSLGDSTFGVVVPMYIADFVPRVRAGLEALGVGAQYLGWVRGPIEWDHAYRSVGCGVQRLPARRGPDARS